MAVEVNNENIFMRKTKAVFNTISIRFVLLSITSMLAVLALIMIIIGNISYWHYYNYAFFYGKGEMGRYVTPSVLCICIGSVLFVVNGFGCYGGLKNSTCVVNTYAAMLSILFILQLVALGLTYSFDRGAIWIDFEIPVWGISDPEIRTQIDYLQSSLGCCGNFYFTDYINIQLPTEMATVKVSMTERILVMPASCCMDSAPVGGYCANIWLGGCTRVLLQTMEHNVIMVGVIFACVMIINLLGMITALLLAYRIRKMKSEKALLRWRIQEEMINERELEASPNQPEAGPSQPQPGPSRRQPDLVSIEDFELETSEV